MKNLFFLSVFLFFGISTANAQSSPIESPQIAIKVPLGATITSGDITITFEEVVKDSRCPKDVQCVWAGNAEVKLTVIQEGKASEEMLVLFENGKQPMIVSTENSSFKAMQLNPYPVSSDQGKREYVLLVLETKKG